MHDASTVPTVRALRDTKNMWVFFLFPRKKGKNKNHQSESREVRNSERRDDFVDYLHEGGKKSNIMVATAAKQVEWPARRTPLRRTWCR